VFLELPEDFTDHLSVPQEVCVYGEDVIEVYHNIPTQDEVLEDVIHHSLEGCGGVGQAEVHHQGFEKPLVGVEGSLPLITLSDLDVVEPPENIELCEELGSF